MNRTTGISVSLIVICAAGGAGYEVYRRFQSMNTKVESLGRNVDRTAEIAEVHGRPVATIKTWLHRTRLEILTYLRSRGMVPAAMTSEPPAKQ